MKVALNLLSFYILSITLLTFVSVQASECQKSLLEDFTKTNPSSEIELTFIVGPEIHLERRLVDSILVETCNEELNVHQYDDPSMRLACNLINAPRPSNLSWYEVSSTSFFSDVKVESKQIVGVNNSCQQIYSTYTYYDETYAD